MAPCKSCRCAAFKRRFFRVKSAFAALDPRLPEGDGYLCDAALPYAKNNDNN